ncbi:MAG: hypothetical protein AB7Q00_04565 [Phycisphaerales bacterium]
MTTTRTNFVCMGFMRAAGTLVLFAAGVAGVMSLGGCAGTPKPTASGSLAERKDPVGLKIQWWLTGDTRARTMSGAETLAGVLRTYETRVTPLEPSVLKLWRANGLRVLAIPVGELDLVRERLRASGATHEQILGQIYQWMPIVTGPSWEGTSQVQMDNGLLELPAGSIRMLARGWFAPPDPVARQEQKAASLRLELLLQHEERTKSASDLVQALGQESPKTEYDAGLAFTRLGVTCDLSGREALLLVAEDPKTEWDSIPERLAVEDENLPPTVKKGAVFLERPRLGSLLLSADPTQVSARRVVMLIIPVVPAAEPAK